MTGQKIAALPEVDDDELRTLNHLIAELEAREPRNYLRACYYDGRRALRQVGSVIPPQYYRLGLVLGWSAKAVDILARRTNLDGFVWPDGSLDSLGAGDIFEANFQGSEISGAMTSSLIHGVSYLITTKGDPAEHEPAVLFHTKDARNAYGDWNTRTRRLDNTLSVTERDEDGKICGLVLYLPNVTITADREDGAWTATRSPHPWGVPVEPLVYKPRTGRPMGTSRISRPVMSLHDQALRTIIRLEGHMDVYSFPELWLLGADESIFKNADGSRKEAWQVMLGRIKAIPDDEDAETPRADVKQFSASSPQPHIDALKMQASLFAGETDLPVTALGVQAQTNTTTADGSDNAERQLIAEAEGATDDWSPALRRAEIRALMMAQDLSEMPASWKTIAPKFRSPVYLSRAAAADAGMKQLTAVPWLAETSVGLELIGLNEQQVKTATAERQRSQGRAILDRIKAGPASAGNNA